MTSANRTRLNKAGVELIDIARLKGNAQDKMLAILRTLELLQSVQVDLVLRPEVNSD